jgi:hypothetical protein
LLHEVPPCSRAPRSVGIADARRGAGAPGLVVVRNVFLIFSIVLLVNRRETYLLEALLQLAASYPSSLKIGEIARRRAIPEAFLARLLAGAARRGVVATSRGPRGGVRLVRSPETMTLAEILENPVQRPAASPATAWLADQLAQARTGLLASVSLYELLSKDHETEAFIWNI